MPAIALSRVSFHYGPIDIFCDLTLSFPKGWTGIVGDNGAGKTTLLRLVTGQLSPTGGHRRSEPAEPRCVVCPQTVDQPGSDIVRFAGSFDRLDLRWQARLDLHPSALERWQSLSFGERKRWQLGAALSQQPDVLALDEPTNHVDAETRSVLRTALAGFRGVGLLVSHDRALLDELSERTVRVHEGTALMYGGAYSHARQQWLAERAAAEERAQAAQSELASARRRLTEERRNRASAERSIRTSSRAKSRQDSDARSMRRKGLARNAEAKLSRAVQKQRRVVERAAVRAGEHRLTRQRGRSLFVDVAPAPKQVLCHLELEVLQAGGTVLARDLSLLLRRDSRVHIAGRNGAGKTTLLAALVARLGDGPHVLHLPQELSLQARRSLAADLRVLPPADRGRLLELAAALGLAPERVLASQTPSPGEGRKLALALGLARNAHVLVLDEPTNHLDLPSIERLERALADFPGALVIATHDRGLAEALTHERWAFADRGQPISITRR